VDLRTIIEGAVAFEVARGVVVVEGAEVVIGVVDSRVNIVLIVAVVREAIAFKSQRKKKIYIKQFCAICSAWSIKWDRSKQ
jgi:hypothetical protein